MNEKCKKYDDMSDVFEYGNISDDEIVKLCNQILLESKDEKNDIILETMYHAHQRTCRKYCHDCCLHGLSDES